MNLRWRTFLIICGTLAVLLAVLQGVATRLLSQNVAAAEAQEARRGVQGVVALLTQSNQQFEARFRDWSAWDDAYAFMASGDPEFVRSNLVVTALKTLQLDVVAFVRPDGHAVFATGFDRQRGVKVSVPQELAAHLRPGDPLLTFASISAAVSGLLITSRGPLLLTSQPIVTTENKGPIRGAFIAGRLLVAEEVRRLEAVLHTPITLRPLATSGSDADSAVQTLRDVEPGTIQVRPVNESTQIGVTLMRDVFRRPALAVEVTLPRTIYAQGRQGQSSLLALLLVAGVVLAALSLFLIERQVSTPLRQAIGVMSSVAAEFAVTLEEQESVSGQQVAVVADTSAAMEQLGQASRLAAREAGAAAGSAGRARELVEGGTQLADTLLSGMDELQTQSAAVSSQIQQLSRHTAQIGSITHLVGELAGQTNLLALNAAVEAARAGQHGAGFAVIAQEIQRLADESRQSAERIGALVGEIRRSTETAVRATESGERTAMGGAQLSRRSGAAFHEVAGALRETALSVERIAQSAHQQATAVEQVLDAMRTVDTGAREASAAVRLSRAGVQRLNKAAGNLSALV